jgi:hypothetical protein
MEPNHRLQRLMASQHIVLMDNDIPHLCEEWMGKITDLISGIPLELPPLHEVNHEINLVDPMKRIRYRLPKCPRHFHKYLSAKIDRYTTAAWWVPAVVHQAVPMLYIPKRMVHPYSTLMNKKRCRPFDHSNHRPDRVRGGSRGSRLTPKLLRKVFGWVGVGEYGVKLGAKDTTKGSTMLPPRGLSYPSRSTFPSRACGSTQELRSMSLRHK